MDTNAVRQTTKAWMIVSVNIFQLDEDAEALLCMGLEFYFWGQYGLSKPRLVSWHKSDDDRRRQYRWSCINFRTPEMH